MLKFLSSETLMISNHFWMSQKNHKLQATKLRKGSKVEITAQKYNLDEFLNQEIINCEKINVPNYQREYSWDEEAIKLVKACYFPDKKDKEVFIGTFYFKKISESQIDLIDGQQRLTTFLITLRIFDLIMKEYESKSNFAGTPVSLDKYYLTEKLSKLQSSKKQNSESYDLVFRKTNINTLLNTKSMKRFDFSDNEKVNWNIIKSYCKIWLELRARLAIKGEEDINYENYSRIKNLVTAHLNINLAAITFGKSNKRFIFRTFRALNSTSKPLYNLELLHSAIFEMSEKEGNKFQSYMERELYREIPGHNTELKQAKLEIALADFAAVATLENKSPNKYKSSFDIVHNYLYDDDHPEEPLNMERLNHLKNYLKTYVKLLEKRFNQRDFTTEETIVRNLIELWNKVKRGLYVKFLIDMVARRKSIWKARSFLIVLNNIVIWSALQDYQRELSSAINGYGKPGNFDHQTLRFGEIYRKIYKKHTRIFEPRLPVNFDSYLDGQHLDNIPTYLNTHYGYIFEKNDPEMQEFYQTVNIDVEPDLIEMSNREKQSKAIWNKIESLRKELDQKIHYENLPIKARAEFQKINNNKWYALLKKDCYINIIMKLFTQHA